MAYFSYNSRGIDFEAPSRLLRRPRLRPRVPLARATIPNAYRRPGIRLPGAICPLVRRRQQRQHQGQRQQHSAAGDDQRGPLSRDVRCRERGAEVDPGHQTANAAPRLRQPELKRRALCDNTVDFAVMIDQNAFLTISQSVTHSFIHSPRPLRLFGSLHRFLVFLHCFQCGF